MIRKPPVEITSLRFERVSFGYPDHPMVFKDLSLDVAMNTSVFVTGAGGSGLSTFLKILAVMLQPTSGRFFLNGVDTAEMTFEQLLPYRMLMGYSFEVGGLFANRTMHENLTLPLLYHKRCSADEANEIANLMARDYSFESQKHQRPAHVSGGLRKLICVLRSLVLHPQMLVLDDPFSGIGMEAARNLVHTIQERREAGELKHLFLTSRDEIWPHWMGCDTLYLEDGGIRFEERMVA